jgi:hypothetical protein
MIVPYLPVRELIAQVNDRDCFPADVSNDEIMALINAAERLVGRARQELSNRWTDSLRADQKSWASQKPG